MAEPTNVITKFPYNENKSTVMKSSCAHCKKESSLVCERCGEFYCSTECQDNDWSVHRYFCFLKPALVKSSLFYKLNCKNVNSSEIAVDGMENLGQQPTEEPKSDPFPRTNTRVLIMSVYSTNHLYVRSLEPNDNMGYLLNCKKINEYARTAKPLTELPEVQTHAIAKYKENFHCVRIVYIKDSQRITVVFSDLCIKAVLGLSDLREISTELLNLPTYGVGVRLQSVPYLPNDIEAENFVSQFINKEFIIRYKHKPFVKLFDSQSESCLNETIDKFLKDKQLKESPQTVNVEETKNLSKFSESEIQHDAIKSKKPSIKNKMALLELAEEAVMTVPFKTILFEEGTTNLECVIVDNSCLSYSYIGCIASKDVSKLALVQKFIKDSKDVQTAYTPRLNDYCIAKFEDDWYRAKIVEILDDSHFSVVYIDFTNEAELTAEDIRPYPVGLTNDCLTNLCCIKGMPLNLNEAQMKFFKNELEIGSDILISKILDIKEDIVYIEIDDLKKKMQAAKIF